MPLAWVRENHRVKDVNCQNPLYHPQDHIRLLPGCRAFRCREICGCLYRSKGAILGFRLV